MPPYFVLKSIALTLRLLRKLLLPPIKSSPDEIISIPSRDPGRSIKIHIYRPPLASTTTSSTPPTTNAQDHLNADISVPKPPLTATTKTNPPTPVHINLCGSGFVLSGHGLDNAYCRLLSTSVPALTVLDIEYRLAPEHPFPATLQDVEDAVRWVQAQPETYDSARISIGGFSAGAALAVSMAGHTSPDTTFSALIAFYPAVDASVSPWKKKAPERDGSSLPGWLLWVFQSCYLYGGEGRAKDTRVSPALMDDLSGFPGCCLFVTAGQCSLASEAEELGARLLALGEGGAQGERRVVVQRMEGCGHAWDKLAKEGSVQWEKRERAYALAVEMLS